MIDTKVYEELLCDDCKANIVEQTSKLKLIDKMRPMRVAKKSRDWICVDCRSKITAVLSSRRGSSLK